MTISFHRIRNNLNMVELNGKQLYFSYDTLIAIRGDFNTVYREFKTSTKYSTTTSRHMNQLGMQEWLEVPQEELENMIEGLQLTR